MKIYTEVIMEWDEDKGELVEVSSESYEQYNNLYSITEIGIGSDTQFNVSSASSIAGFTTRSFFLSSIISNTINNF